MYFWYGIVRMNCKCRVWAFYGYCFFVVTLEYPAVLRKPVRGVADLDPSYSRRLTS
jgi:hypothetical protein